jgi:hypothetical protein
MGDIQVSVDLVRHERDPAGLDFQEGDPALLAPFDDHRAVWPGNLACIVGKLDLDVGSNPPSRSTGLSQQGTPEFRYSAKNRQQPM